MNCIVVIPAAGTGSRFGGELPKQFVEFRGRPLIVHTIERVLSVLEVERVIVAVSEEQQDHFETIIERERWDRVRLVLGGASRQESVLKAIRALEHERRKIVAVHDAVRPFVSHRLFRAAVESAALYGAALPVVPLHDTVHELEDGQIARTLDRSRLFAAQTPQCFQLELALPLLERAWHEALSGTDEAGIIASYGVPVRTVEGEPANLKITTPEDLELADRFFDRWSRS